MIKRLKDAQKRLVRGKLDALLISSTHNIGYLTGFFGFSKTEREGYLLLTTRRRYIFASGLNSEAVKRYIASLKDFTLVEISPRTPLTKKALVTIIKKERIKKLGFEKHSLTYAEYERLKKDLSITLVPTEHVIEELRMIKDADEIAAIEKACKLGDKAFDYILTKIKPIITEKELAWELEVFIRREGYELSFPTIVAFGFNSCIPHHVTSDKRLAISDKLILLDFGCRVDNYCSDMTRTVFFGKATYEQKRMYNTVLEAQKRAFENLQHSNDTYHHSAKHVDKIARDYIASQNYPNIPHSLGHGIGLEVHEPPKLSPKSKDILKPNMVFSIEPGNYLPGIGGVRIEDLIALEPAGPRFLTKAKRELIEV